MKLPSLPKDIFSIEEAESYRCHIFQYRQQLGEMFIELRYEPSPDYFFYLVFRPVVYFSGPMGWVGANFHLGSRSECFNIARPLQRFRLYSDDMTLQDNNLYVREGPEGTVKIIANHFLIAEKLPGYVLCQDD